MRREMASRVFSVVHDGRRFEVEPEGSWSGTTVRLRVDGEPVTEAKGTRNVVVAGAGVEVRVRLAWHGESIMRADLVAPDDDRPILLDPPPGTRAARREAFARKHPGLYAARHAVGGVGKVLLGLVGFAVLLRLLPDLPLPSIDLPSIDLPDLSLPKVDLIPDPPGWLQAILDSAKYWGPILAGLAYAAAEYHRRKRARAPDERA